jgi:hypothetical protein
MRENLLKKQPTWGLRRAQGTGQKSATPATLTKVILVLLTMFLLPSAAWGQGTITVAGNAPESDGTFKDKNNSPISGVTFDAQTNTLMLNGAILGIDESNPENNNLVSIESGLDALTINLQGKNKLYGTITTSNDFYRTLAFTGSGSLEISGESSAVSGFENVTLNNDLYLKTNEPGTYWVAYTGFSAFGNSVNSITITPEEYYPIWVISTDGSSYIQVSGDNCQHILGETNTTVTYDKDNNMLTLDNYNGSTTDGEYAISLGDVEELEVYLKGENTINGSGVGFAREVASLTFSTNEDSSGKLTIGSNYLLSSIGDSYITYKNGLGYKDNVVSNSWCRIKIGNIEVTEPGTTNLNGFEGVSFNATTNTLTLTNAAITSGASGDIDIDVYLKNLTVEISGSNTINGRFYGHYKEENNNQGTIFFKKASNAPENTSLAISGDTGDSGPIYEFSECTWDEGLYLTEAKKGTTTLNGVYYNGSRFKDATDTYVPDYVLISDRPTSASLWIGDTSVTTDNATNVFEGDENLNGKVSVTFGDTNILTLNGATLEENIISSLPNLTIKLAGENNSNNLFKDIISTNPSATLTFTTDGNNSLFLNLSENLPWRGFAGNPTFENKLVFCENSDVIFLKVLEAPTMVYSSGNLTFGGLSDGYKDAFDCYYTITYEDGDGSITDPIKYVSANPVSMAEKPCTVTAYVTYKDRFNNTTQSETAIGKYFGIADKRIVFNNKTKGSELTVNDLETIPATEGEGVSFTFNSANNQEVISYSYTEETGSKFSIAGIGICEVGFRINVNNPTIQVLNPDNPALQDGVRYAEGIVTVVPDEPTITITKKDPERNYYLNTDEIAITRTIVEGENADNIKIFYTWGDATIGSNYFHYTDNPTLSIYDATKPILAQTGTLRAWVGYHLGDNEYLMSDEVESEKFTVKTDISDYTVQGLATSATYTGAAIVPAFSVKASADAETSLTLNTDYTVSYQSVIIAAGDVGSGPSINYTDVDEMVEVGAYRIVITGTGDNYGGTTYADFAIDKADLSDYVVTGLTTPTAYTGSPITPTFSVKATETAETSLTANTDYSVKYQQADADVDEMKDAGAYKIIITGEGNYKGSLDADFTIDRATLNLTINLEGWTYGDTPNVPSLDGNLDEGVITWEYKATGADTYSAWSTLTTTTDAGTYMVRATVAETDNYAGGSKEAEFVIEQLDISQADITLDNTVLTYNGEQQTVNVTKVMAGNIEVPIDCYEVSGNTEKEAGDYKLTVTAKTMDSSGDPIKNNFTGSAEKDWKIKNRTVTTDELGLSENQSQATYYSETEDLEVPEGVVAYIITGVNGNNVVTQRIRYIPKRVAVFVEQTTSTENPLEVIPDASELPLKGTAVDLNVASISGGTVYVLYKGEFVKSTTGTIPAKRCYLLLPNNVAAGTRAFGIIGGGSDGSTAIKSINDEPSTIDNWYDMGGHRIEKPTKTGIYIKNGKIVVINNK